MWKKQSLVGKSWIGAGSTIITREKGGWEE